LSLGTRKGLTVSGQLWNEIALDPK
jgi:hypothetical protein